MIPNIKKAYMKHRNTISETGQGLLDDGLESTFIQGSDIKNAWGMSIHVIRDSFSYFLADVIAKVFPWYMQMHVLMGTSPVVDRSAMAHSGTPLNLDIITHSRKDRSRSDDEYASVKVGPVYYF
jgi:hypothetical protein